MTAATQKMTGPTQKMTGPTQKLTGSVQNLSVHLTRDGVRSHILRGVDLDIAPGEIVGLVGESGSGKSVLALAMLGLLPESSDPQTTGSITVAGVDMVHGTPADLRTVRRTELGAIFQDPMTSLNPTMRIGRQITEVTGDTDEAVRLLTTVGITDASARLRAYPHELSGGLRQRVMAAIAVSGRPSLIIADEPTTALDVTVQAQVLDLLRELRDDFGCSVLMITHDLGVASQIADRIVVLYAGRVAESGATTDVLLHPTHPYTVGLLGARLSLAMPRQGILATLAPETASAAERLLGCAYHSRCPLATRECATDQPPLESIAEQSTPGQIASDSAHDRACWRTTNEVIALTSALPLRTTEPLPDLDGLPVAGRVPSSVAVDIRDLVCTFTPTGGRRAQPVYALRGVSLEVGQGEAVAIVGESGSGKSTLLRVVAGLTPATGGSATLARGGAQMVFQDAGSSLTPWLSVGEILAERLRPLRLGKSAVISRVEEALHGIGLPPAIAKARPSELSGGQKQRVVLARATIIPPAVLLCDEPTSALDASLAATVLNLIREMRERLNMTLLFVTHDLSVARLMGDRIAVMYRGEFVEIGASDDVISRPQNSYTAALLASVPEIAAAAQGGTR
jgi:peptide/nickel transport system ATP-binding protein